MKKRRLKLPRRPSWILSAALLAFAAVSLTYGVHLYGAQLPARLAATPTPSPTAPPHPLSIAGLRAHQYAASPLVTERGLGNQGGYTNAVVSYQSDGLKQYALMSTPAGNPPAGGWPVIILLHGYINPASYRTTGSDYAAFIATFARQGYVVLKPDYRGHDQSEGQPGGGHFAPDYAHDTINLVETLKQAGRINPKRIGLLGHSLGGHVALRTIVTSTDVKATAIMAGVVGSMDDLFYNWRRSPTVVSSFSASGLRQQLVAQYGEPRSNPAFWSAASAINYVDAVTGPVQLHHSLADSSVPYLFSERLAGALQAKNKPVELYSYTGDDHQFLSSRNLLLQRLISFFRTNL